MNVKRKPNSALLILLCMVLLSCAATAALAYLSLAHRPQEKEQGRMLLSEKIYEGLSSEIQRLQCAAQTVSGDIFLRDFLAGGFGDAEGDDGGEAAAQRIQLYLQQLIGKPNFSSAFIASLKNGMYYAHSGQCRLLESSENGRDAWLASFLASDDECMFSVRTGATQAGKKTLYVCARLSDAAGLPVGILGIGMGLSSLRAVLEKNSQAAGVQAVLVDEMGMVQVSALGDGEDGYLMDLKLNLAESEAYTYSPIGKKGFSVTKLLASLRWYLVVYDMSASGTSDLPSFAAKFLALAAALCVLSAMLLFLINKRGAEDTEIDATEDAATGLPNRNYFRQAYGEDGFFNTMSYKSLAVLDIDSFSSISPANAANALVLDIVSAIKSSFSGEVLCMRWSRDCFVIFSDLDSAQTTSICQSIGQGIFEKKSVGISVGVAEISLADSIKKNYYRALRGCYMIKEAGGNGVQEV